MTKQPLHRKGHFGIYVPYAMLLVDLVLVVLLMLGVCEYNHVFPPRSVKIMLVIAFMSYLPLSQMSMELRNARTVSMERLVIKAFQISILYSIIFFAIITFLDLDLVPWKIYLEYFLLLIICLPLSWIATRIAVKALRRSGRNYNDVIIIGQGDNARRLAGELQADPGYGYKIQGYFDVERPEHFTAGKYLGDIYNDLEEYLKHNKVDEIYYTLDGADEKRLKKVIRLADEHMITFFYVPNINRRATRAFAMSHIGSMPVLVAHQNPLDSPTNRVLKRGFDILFSSVVLLCSPIVFIPVAIAIKLSSPGPIFFKQRRTGYLGNEFTCWKFRTMRVNNDADARQATADDPRKTRVGDFLRRSSIDELPQFINVLMGDMSVVGPRPHMVKQTADYSRLIDTYMLRHLIKPGITGWAQVLGYRGATKELWQMEGRVEKDVWYIENWSILLDIKIIIRTVTNAICGEENAY